MNGVLPLAQSSRAMLPLPRASRAVVLAARGTALLAGQLIGWLREPMITISCKTDVDRMVPVLHLWVNGADGRFAIVRLRAAMLASADMRVAAAKLLRAAQPLLDDLLDRWPPYAAPQTLGVVCDGMIVAFNQAEPSGLKPEWYDHHMNGVQHATLLPQDTGQAIAQTDLDLIDAILRADALPARPAPRARIQ
jgi:hypothetical protein